MKQLWLAVCAAALLFTSCAAEHSAASRAPGASAPPEAAQAAVQGIQDPGGLDAALDGLLPFGPGEAGVSLKSAIAATGLLDWAEDSAASSAIPAMTAHMERWLEQKTPEEQARFWLNWPGVNDLAQAIARDLAGHRDLLADAGSPHIHDGYTPARYQRLACAVEKIVDAGLTSP